MEDIDIKFLTNLGWQEYQSGANAPKDCFYKKPYPIALWWDESHKGFWVIYLNELTLNLLIIGKDFIKTEAEYNRLIIPILKIIQESQRKQHS
jgi:hypothetical protein